MAEAGDESSEDEELLACCFVNINLDSKAKCACKPYEHRAEIHNFCSKPQLNKKVLPLANLVN